MYINFHSAISIYNTYIDLYYSDVKRGKNTSPKGQYLATIRNAIWLGLSLKMFLHKLLFRIWLRRFENGLTTVYYSTPRHVHDSYIWMETRLYELSWGINRSILYILSIASSNTLLWPHGFICKKWSRVCFIFPWVSIFGRGIAMQHGLLLKTIKDKRNNDIHKKFNLHDRYNLVLVINGPCIVPIYIDLYIINEYCVFILPLVKIWLRNLTE
jgi:hypothetical protein